MKGHLKRNRMTQISASYHLPVQSYECIKKTVDYNYITLFLHSGVPLGTHKLLEIS